MRASGVRAQPFCDACRRTGLTAPRVPSAMTSDSVKVRMVWRADGVASSLRIDRVRAAGGFPLAGRCEPARFGGQRLPPAPGGEGPAGGSRSDLGEGTSIHLGAMLSNVT